MSDVNENAGVVKEGAAAQMQHVSTAEVTNRGKEDVARVAQLGIVMLITFDNVNPIKATTHQLQALKNVTHIDPSTGGATVYDLYNPISAKSAERGTPAGVLRNYFTSIYRIISQISGSRPLFIGREAERADYVQEVAAGLMNTLIDSMPFAQALEIVPKGEFDQDSIRFRDILSVKSWTDTVKEEGVDNYTVFLNLIVNSAKLQQDADKFKANVLRTYQRLQGLIEKAQVDTPISAWLVFREDAQTLLTDTDRADDWYDLVEELGFDVLTQAQYRRLESTEPGSVSWIQPKALFGDSPSANTVGADTLYFVSLTPELDAPAEEELEDSVEEGEDDAED